ncbi:hypothetical protein DERF_012190 [Dermatophagoides farinae]|uniref:Uncharacterized protein n=1 Tax=Dermatophagoides farinae TaxID=6954 RepID=A0A922HT13_DERFA|nr:hypothetical protein DERF_012190 [Dermatophagoides farinae]
MLSTPSVALKIDTFGWMPSRGGGAAVPTCGYPVILTVKEKAPQGQPGQARSACTGLVSK